MLSFTSAKIITFASLLNFKIFVRLPQLEVIVNYIFTLFKLFETQEPLTVHEKAERTQSNLCCIQLFIPLEIKLVYIE
ncbi:hypothetical protein SAMN05443252_101130 [Bacillus sp. OV322]|nr:hypothetical protein SAMN05443252_101130 [Bacillus sp. OV322]